MYNWEISEHLQKILKKLSKKDSKLYKQVIKKIDEVVNSYNVENYKNLRHRMKESKRAHIGYFVLVFRYDKKSNLILFDDLDHHDNIYKR